MGTGAEYSTSRLARDSGAIFRLHILHERIEGMKEVYEYTREEWDAIPMLERWEIFRNVEHIGPTPDHCNYHACHVYKALERGQDVPMQVIRGYWYAVVIACRQKRNVPLEIVREHPDIAIWYLGENLFGLER
jgi:hypothetical protein